MSNMITIGLPVYNAMPYLTECVESLRSQGNQNFSILAIDDGSRDESLAYLQSLDWPVLKVVSQKNHGVTATLNRMLHEVKTPWLLRQDADDVSYPNRIEVVLRNIEADPEAGMIHSAAQYYPKSESVGRFRVTTSNSVRSSELVRNGYLISACHPSVALNVKVVAALGGYRDIKHAEDADLWWRVALHSRIHYIDEVLVGVRQNTASVSSRNLREQAITALYVQYRLLSELTNRTPRAFSEIAAPLQLLFRERDFRARVKLRDFNMLLSKSYASAALSLLQAFACSPSFVIQRICDELFPDDVVSGLDPREFYYRAEELWGPQAPGLSTVVALGESAHGTLASDFR